MFMLLCPQGDDPVSIRYCVFGISYQHRKYKCRRFSTKAQKAICQQTIGSPSLGPGKCLDYNEDLYIDAVDHTETMNTISISVTNVNKNIILALTTPLSRYFDGKNIQIS